MTSIATKDFLLQIGFSEIKNPSGMSSSAGSVLEFDFGNFTLLVSESLNKHLQEVFKFFGMSSYERIMSEVNFELPIEIESYEQGLALVSFGLGSHFSAIYIPNWYYEGLRLKNHLPWRKEIEEFNQRPCACIEYDYFKLIIKKMKEISASPELEDVTTISFNGETLSILCSGIKIIAPASGKAWKEIAAIKTRTLSCLPKRIKKQGGCISLWKSNIFFDNVAITLDN